ncbi:MAG: putative DNA binding domain-containing protein [Bacteroidales bacterium]|jgi:ATP-dependent DNA helicase RecG|nr:putative DNA binding domain-containing protein [Bacteroidales bacterium]
MISDEQIRALLNDIENVRVERTISTDNTDKFAKAVCAFANDLPNTRVPGYLMIGAFDDGTLNGLKVTDRLLRNLAGLRADGNIQPKPALMVWKASFPDGDIAIVEVQPSKITPVKYKGVTYVRIGARKAEANEEEERILREKSEVKSPTFDTTPCLHSTIDDLDLDLFKKEYLPKFVKASVLKNDKRTVKQQLVSLQLFDSAHDCPTVAGIMLIGKDPKHILFGSYIQYVQFAGKSRTSKVLNERQFSGNLLTMLKELDYFIKYTIQKQRPVFVTVLREEMRINYPYEAIRELAMNLVMHRNYQTNAPAKCYEYSDRIEIDNPGGLYGKVSPDNFPNETDYRNPVIAVAMKTLGYVNQFGRGIEMVQEELEANKNGLAMFKFDDITTFKVTVMNADLEAVKMTENEAGTVQKRHKDIAEIEQNTENNSARVGEMSEKRRRNVGEMSEKNVGEKLTERQKIILKYISQSNIISAKEISVLLQITDRTIEREMQKLKKMEILERIGGDRGGYWKIKQ